MTKLIYLSDTYIFDSTATIEETGENEYWSYIILDRTIFYPQWGWQPSDTGIITSDTGRFVVSMVRLNEHGIVYHYGRFQNGTFKQDDSIELSIDREKRIINARNHSAGHLLDVAMWNIWMRQMKPSKGYHFIEGPYVEYIGTLEQNTEDFIKQLETEVNTLIKKNIPMIISYAVGIRSPQGKQPRYAHFEWYIGCGCGGTHISHSGEIWKITIRKIKMKDGNLRISYNLV